MNYSKIWLIFGFIFGGLFAVNNLNAQYIIYQVEYKIPVNYDLVPEEKEFSSPIEEARFFLQLPQNKLEAALPAEEGHIQKEKTVIYIDGDNLAVESQSEEGNISMVSNFNEKKFYLIYWPMKKVVVMTREDFEKTQQQAQNIADKMLEGLSPEMRQKIEAEMAKEKATQARPWKVNATGVKGQKYGFDCEQYLAERPDELILIWATDQYPEVVEKARTISEKLDAVFPEDELETDEWELVAGKVPVEVRRFETDEMGNPVISVLAIERIEKAQPPKEKFAVPGADQGFTHTTLQEFMQEMMRFEER